MKRILKRIVFLIALVVTAPLSFGSWLEKWFTRSEAVFVSFGQLLSLVPGTIGSYLRAAYFYSVLPKSSWEIHIGFGSFLCHRSAALGRHVAVGSYCVIGCADIGDEVMIASGVSIPSGKRQHLREDGKVSSEPVFDKVSIGRNSWIGEGAIVLASIGNNCIVSAGTVMTSVVPENCLVGGNPGRIIRRLNNTG